MPLTPDHARLLNSLLATLTAEEALWISGYLAGFASQPRLPQAATSADIDAPLVILYGSETGHAEGLARRAEELAQAGGLAVRRVAMADFRPQDMRAVRRLLVLTSTHGEGDPPEPAVDFYEFLQGRKAPRLEGVKFAVLGLGDSSYEHFCQTAKDIDHRLEELGAERIHARAECDVDFERTAVPWLDAALTAFARESRAGAGAPAAELAPQHAATLQLFDQNRPFPATILDSLVLNGRGSDKETRHIELSLAGSGLAWEPGDSLGVVPENDPALVADIISALELKADEPVPVGAEVVPLVQALTRGYEITTLSRAFIERYAAAADAEKLRALNGTDLWGYMAGRQILDVVTEFPVRGLGSRDFVAMLRPLQPRLYSVASSPAAYPEEAHLTVAVVRYESRGRTRRGVASTFLADSRGIDQSVPVYVSSNKNFRLPADPTTPIIMIGPGTGVAPFRSFVQQREVSAATGRNWLFFGARRFRTDFLYQTEWQRWLKDGRLTRMDVAFSREQGERIYVQHRLLECSREIYAWLEDGACVYVCGDGERMAKDVQAALADVVASEGGKNGEQAQEYLRELQRQRRYQRDVY